MTTEAEPARLVCHCFGYTFEDLERDPGIAAVIEDHVRAGRCACKVRNPQGICCLNDVRRSLSRPGH
ncbi:MAG: hypothetical protein ABR576_10780 [Thermoanaerobaculia bacterium]